MEDGSDGPLSDVEVPDTAKNGLAPLIMAKFPETAAEEEQTKVNGETIPENNLYDDDDDEDSFSSESDALIIDESVPKKQKGKRGKQQRKILENSSNAPDEHETLEEEQQLLEEQHQQQQSQELSPSCLFAQAYTSPPALIHSNPYFNESLFELSQLHQNPQPEDNQTNAKSRSKKGKAKPKPRLREYAQYLGLQPAVQFKCSKCGRAGFESFATLQEHRLQCNSENIQECTENSSSGFKLTRKVFLCSACGTYYENWNLYMHMLEFHKRFICLYCLGMFSVLEDLCQHIQSRHNFEPGYKNSLDEFFNVFNEPCYVVCCECNKLFSEQDNFFYHNCSKSNVKGKKPTATKTQITPENHVTGESETVDERTTLDKEVEDINGLDDNRVDEKPNDDDLMENNKGSSDILTHDDDFCQNLTENNSDKTDENKDLAENSNNDGDEDVQNEPNNDCIDTVDAHIDVPRDELMETEDSMDHLVETRKVPKLSLKLPKPSPMLEEDSDDSEKVAMEMEPIESDNENEIVENREMKECNQEQPDGTCIDENEREEQKDINNTGEEHHEEMKTEEVPQVAGSDIPIIELQLEQPLDKFDPRVLLQKCLKTTVPTCIFCNHARKISVNGKQLALHCIAEHRFSAVVNSITAEELIPENFVNRLTESLDDLEKSFFNLECSFSDEAITFSHVFECFQCYFSTSVHKELYLHNRKFHSKNLLLCIMCKSNFYSYSELVCHLCPGQYVLDYDLEFRCCMCVNDDLPSSFRLMVHLRKKHNVCDVCLEMCHTQYRLSNHVWKHKLHHFCYRCGIAYRNKPDITRHLFWKHGTESVLCKRCLQKKWPHVYHFCVPPVNFTCEECNLNFTRAVSLKVHKRVHTDEKKHECTLENCQEKFISKKLLMKHEKWHLEPPEEEKPELKADDVQEKDQQVDEELQGEAKGEDKLEEKLKPKIDVLDLPALNLSESDSSDSEPESTNKPSITPENTMNTEDESHKEEVEPKPEPESDLPKLENEEDDKLAEPPSVNDMDSSNSVIQNIWDNFKNYQASKEKIDSLFSTEEKSEEKPSEEEKPPEEFLSGSSPSEVVLLDHDYCVNPEKTTDSSIIEVKPALTLSDSVDHDYCSPKPQSSVTPSEKLEMSTAQPKVLQEIQLQQQLQKPENKKVDSSSSSSSDTDSSCSCGSNCSCSSSSGSSSSSSDSSNSDSSTEEGRKRQLARRQKRRERAKKMKEGEGRGTVKKKPDPIIPTDPTRSLADAPIRESDLETTESETDEEFYDRAPQKLAKKILEEKRQQLLATVGPHSFPNGSFIESTSRPPTPPAGLVEEADGGEERKKSKKSKSKKRKKKKSDRTKEVVEEPCNILTPDVPIPPYYQQFHHQQQQLLQPPMMTALTSLLRDSPAHSPPMTPAAVAQAYSKMENLVRQESSDTSLRASKRRRVPNKFYGYSSDEDADKPSTPKWRKTEFQASHTPRSPLTVPPITIKTTPQPQLPPQQVVEPISIRTGAHLSDFRVRRPKPRPSAVPPLKLLQGSPNDGRDSATESNDSSSEEQTLPPKPVQPQLYCYCRCPYDEVSEMIGCDASDCAIEWFHFECVGIMVPPKGQWFCPDCRKKKQQKREMLLQQQQAANKAFEQF